MAGADVATAGRVPFFGCHADFIMCVFPAG